MNLAKTEEPLAKTEEPLAKTEEPLAKTKVAKTKGPLAKRSEPLAKTKGPLAKMAKHIETGLHEPFHIEMIETPHRIHPDMEEIVHRSVLAEIREVRGGYKCFYHNQTTYHLFMHGIVDQKEAKTYAQYMVSWLYTVHALFGARACSPVQEFHLYLTVQNKKELPNVEKAMVGEHHVNSAFTYACDPNRSVNTCYIYRSEEWFKVFLHESIHATGLDFMSDSRILAEHFPIHNKIGDIRIAESYVETWADLIYLIYCCRTGDTSYADALNLERRFAVFQVAKLLRHFGMDVDTMDWSKWVEGSSVFSYYFVRMLTLNDPDFTKKWALPYAKGSFAKGSSSAKGSSVYETYVYDLYQKQFPRYKEEIRRFQTHPTNDFLHTTARMVLANLPLEK